MIRRLPIAVCIVALMSFFTCHHANADLTIEFSEDNGVTFSNAFSAQIGEQLDVGIYLGQTGVDSVLTDEGLISFGLELSMLQTDFGSISNVAANPAFDVENDLFSSDSRFVLEYGQSSGVGVTGNQVLLATFTFEPTRDGNTQFAITDRLVGSGIGNASWLTPSFGFLDEDIFGAGAAGSFEFSVNVVGIPEPSNVILVVTSAGFFLARRNRLFIQKINAVD